MEELIYSAIASPRLDARADDVAVIDEGVQHTHQANALDAWRIASALQADYGMSPRDRYAVLAGTGNAYVTLLQTAAWGGGVIAPLNARSTRPELQYVLAHCAPKVVFVDTAHADMVADVRGDVPGLVAVVCIDGGGGSCDVTLGDLLASGEPMAPKEPRADDPLMLLYTGGTTGRPKAVLHSQRTFCLGIHRVHAEAWYCSPRTRYYQCTPLFHITGTKLVLSVLAGGGTVVIRERFDAASAVTDVAEYGLTHLAAVPTQLEMMSRTDQFSGEALGSLEWITYGGSAMPRPLLARYLDLLPSVNFLQGYGMTEAGGYITTLRPDDHRSGDLLGSVGRAAFGVHAQIHDAEGRKLPAGAPGELCARSGTVMVEYSGDPDGTARALRGDWYHTGDVGYMDQQGYFFITGRVDDMLITGGENVFPAEVEAAIIEHPDVREVAVVGVPDDRWGHRLHAVVVCAAHADATPHDIVADARTRIAGYKVPKTIEIRHESLPVSTVGKVDRKALLEQVISAEDALAGRARQG